MDLLPSKKEDLIGNKMGSDDSLNDNGFSIDSPRLELNCFSYENSDTISKKAKHVLEIINCDNHNVLVRAVTSELKSNGVENEHTSRSRSKTRSSSRSCPQENNIGMNKLVEAQLHYCDVKVYIPYILKESCDYIRQHIKTQGIFRKSGSAARAQCIWQRFLLQESPVFSANDTVFEVASVVKQYLREMTVPLIPFDIQNVLLKCLECPSVPLRIEVLLMAICLLPIPNLNILSYLMEFLFDVTQHSQQNNMGYKNLAIVIGPNIMPVQRKVEKSKGALNSEMKLLEVHAKVIEILIQYGDLVGLITCHLDKTLEEYLMPKNSEDELETEGGKRKKRRSGSLTRVLGFLKKVTNGKSGDTPTAATPGDAVNCTPVIKESVKKRLREDFPFSQNKKKTVLDVVRKTGLDGDYGKRASMTDTPNSLSALIACPSPAICLNPSPMKLDWKQTPNGVRFKNLVTPSLLRRKGKRSPGSSNSQSVASSESSKLGKHKLGFGKKAGKKQVTNHGNDGRNLANQRAAVSTVSIHRLASSPRASKLMKNSSSRIPRPENSSHSLRRDNSKSVLKTEAQLNAFELADTTDGSGEYVTISTTAKVSDEKNEAFIASSISLNDSYGSLENSNNVVSTEKLHLTPLIQEIDNLTLCAQQEDYNFSRLMVSSQDSESTLSNSDICGTNLDRIEDKFNKAMKESKIINIVNENENIHSGCVLQRRFSVQEKGISPSQRKIRAARRKSHEIGRVMPVVVQVPKFMSLRSPKSRPTPPPELTRSNSRCTLRRGRPNTMRVGLSRPSPVRGNNGKLNSSVTLCITPSKFKNTPVTRSSNKTPPNRLIKTPEEPVVFQFPIPTPLRRMSSVHELVQIMEKTAKNKVTTCTSHSDNNPVLKCNMEKKAKTIVKPTKVEQKLPTPSSEEVWTDGMHFNFNKRLPDSDKRSKAERDSIHVLKTLNAGKVSENVKLFDGMHNKSPSKSMIPRLTSLHVSNPGNIANVRKTGSLYIKAEARGRSLQPSEARRMIRRFSAVELKNKHEQKLESVKKEITVRRSATTSGTSAGHKSSKDKLNNRRGKGNSPKEKNSVLKGKRRVGHTKMADPSQENLELQSQEFNIILEDEPLTDSVQKAIHNILGSKLDFSEGVKNKPHVSHGSPLKASNLANVNTKDIVLSPCITKSPVSITRVASERGTKCTSNSQTVRSTPRIKKALTTRAYDMLNTPRNCNDFYTPKRPKRVLRDLDIVITSNKTPLKANHNIGN